MKIVYSKYGLANNYGDHIEINKHLKNKKELRDYIIKHELGHKDNFDLTYEFKNIKLLIVLKLFLFCLAHPSTLTDFSPVEIKDKQLYFDLNKTILYFIFVVVVIISIFLLGAIS